MKVNEVMSHEVERVHRDATIHEAARQMKNIDVGMLPVYDGDRLIGTLTDHDITVRAIAEKRSPTDTKVGDVMSPGVTFCFQDQGVEEAAKMMAKHQIRRLIVLNREKRLVGIASLGDLATTKEAKQTASGALEDVSRPTISS